MASWLDAMKKMLTLNRLKLRAQPLPPPCVSAQDWDTSTTATSEGPEVLAPANSPARPVCFTVFNSWSPCWNVVWWSGEVQFARCVRV